MDVLAGLLAGPHAREAFLLKTLLDPPWAIRVEDRAPLSLVCVVRGSAWVLPDGGGARSAHADDHDAVQIGVGDIAILRGPDPYTFADDPATEPQIFVGPDEDCTTVDGTSLAQDMSLGVRTWGNSPTGQTAMLVGTYTSVGEAGQWLLRALPPVAVIRHDTWASPLVNVLSEEIEKEQPGQQVVLDRLLDLLLVGAVREWLTHHGPTPGWFGAASDPIVGRAVRMLQHHPDEQWTVGRLASEVGVSRATLARRFTDLIGQPPMAFLSEWRVALASDLLRKPEASVTSVAREVGYGSPFAFSTAFKRVRGMSPLAYRTQMAGA